MDIRASLWTSRARRTGENVKIISFVQRARFHDSLVDRVNFLGHVHLKRRREGSFTRPVKTGFGAYADRGASFLHGIESESERHLSVDRVEESFRSAT